MQKIFLLIACTLAVITAGAQQTIKGKITDHETGNPLAGATIAIPQTNILAVSGKDGIFTIQSPSPVKSLSISFVGYETQPVTVGANQGFLNIALSTNTYNLNNVTVTGYDNNRKLLETAGAVALLTQRDLQRNNAVSLLPVLNTVPGVKMEEEAPGDFKISLRGSALRDPYGLRNIKVYWNDIPLTSPDNSASHSLSFDPGQIGSIEVIKGPAGSIYGAGMGGVLLLKNDKAAQDETSLATQTSVGSFGLFRSSTTFKTNSDNLNLSANYSHQSYNGYRQQEGSTKDAINLFGQLYVSPKRTISIIANHDEGNFGIAGSVDSAWAMNTPRKAVQFCIDNNTGVRKYTYTMVGVSQKYTFNSLISNTTSVYTDQQTLSHPYGQSIYYNGFLKQNTGGFGGRTEFVFTPAPGAVKSRFVVGDEFQYENLQASTFDIDNAQTGALQSSNIVVDKSNILFAQAELDLPGGFLLTAGASLNNLVYNVTDLVPQSVSHDNYTGIVSFKTTVSPRLALVKTFDKTFALHASISDGFSPPTVSEANNGNGTFNKDLKPETGINYEAGARGTLLGEKLTVDVSLYQLNLSNALLPYYNANGVESFRNAGKTSQKGVEVLLSYLAIKNNTAFISLLKPWLTYAYSDYRFKDYIEESFDYGSGQTVKTDVGGNKVTGVSPDILNAGIDLETKPGLYFNTVLNYVGKTPVNDLNTHYQQAYTLLSAKLGYRFTAGQWGLDIFAGGNNLLDAEYSSWVNFNADATSNPPTFFNPSPGINFYGGINLKYRLK